MAENKNRQQPLKIVNCAELAAPGWTFLRDKIDQPKLSWCFYSAEPVNWIERLITRPRLSRYRACMAAAFRSRSSDVIVTHLPRASWWTAYFARLFGSKAKHLAFSFNFTELPTGRSRRWMSAAFQQIDRFVVYSNAEKRLYADYFGINPSRIDMLPWAMETPAVEPDHPIVSGDYICAVGGEGRDYETLIAASRELPDIPLVIVARPRNVEGLALPEHVSPYTNLPTAQFWNVVKHSRFVVIPLLDDKTNCGHISIVGSMQLGKPLVTTRSAGTEDYIHPDRDALVTEAGSREQLKEAISRLWGDNALCQKMGTEAVRVTDENNREARWVDYLKNYFSTVSNAGK